MINFKSIPFFRILLPYIIGILATSFQLPFSFNHCVFGLSIFLIAISYLAYKLSINHSKQLKLAYSLSVIFFLFILPFETTQLFRDDIKQNHYNKLLTEKHQNLIGYIKETSFTKSKLQKIILSIESIESNKEWHFSEGTSVLYIKISHDSAFKVGDKILIHSKFIPITNPGNPNEFDYKTYMERRNIYHTQFANSKNVHLIINTHRNKLSFIGARIKHAVISSLRNSSLSHDAFSICSALIVGYDDEIDSEVMNSFSHSGTLHMLSVSGLHTGVIYSILMFVFSFIDKNNRFKISRSVIIVFCLFLFVLITGISPSVLRASLMFSLIIIGKAFYRESNSYNTLFLSAFILLIANPFLIYDIGFLLSYTAVFGIIYLYPKLSSIYVFDNKLLSWLWSGACISIAATIFTLPITLYYFHQFPVWFIISNLLVIPIGLFVMFAGIALVVVKKITFLNSIITYIINQSTELMLWLTNLTNHEKIGYIDYIPFSASDALFLTIIITLMIFSFSTKNRIYVYSLIIGCIAWCSCSIYSYINQQKVYNVSFLYLKKKKVFMIQKGNNLLINALDSLNNDEFNRYIKPCLVTISNLNYQIISSNNLMIDQLLFTDDEEIVKLINAKKTFLFVSKPQHKIKIYKSNHTKFVISNSSFIKSLSQLNRNELPLNYYNLKQNGALIVDLN